MLWKNLRVPIDTMTLLKRYRANLETQVLTHPDRYPDHLVQEQLSLGTALHYLLDQQRQHVLRARKAKRAKELQRRIVRSKLKVYDGQEVPSEPPDPQGQTGEPPSDDGG